MTVYYVDSNSASEASPYDTWAKAAHALATIAAIDAAGDTVYVASGHSESTAGAVSLAWAGSVTAPTRIICGTTAAEPPTTYATTGQIATTGANNITANSGATYVIWQGVKFSSGDGANNGSINIGANGSTYAYDCTYILNHTSASGVITFHNSAGGYCFLWNPTFTFGATGQKLNFTNNGSTYIHGGSTAGSAITQLVAVTSSSSGVFTISGLDASSGASSMNILSTTQSELVMVIRDCKLPGSWSGSLNASTPGPGAVQELHNCDSGDTHYNYIRQVQGGTTVDETTLVKTGGAADSDGTQLSWKCTANANASQGALFRTAEIYKLNSTVGSSVTITVDVLHDSATNLTNAEIWLEAMILTTSGVPLGTWVADDIGGDNSGNRLASAADQASSSATWNTTGMSNPNKQKLSVTVTPQETGYIIARVAMATANTKVVYIDPLLQFS